MSNMRKDIKSEDNRISKSKSNSEEVDMKNTAISKDHLVKCELCDTRFSKMSDLENHITTKHELHQTFECEKCKKKFLTKWRLQKHDTDTAHWHQEQTVQICQK